MKKHFLNTCLLLVSVVTFAQTADTKKAAANDLKSINESYKNLAGLSMSVGYTLYKEHNSTVPKEQHTGYYCKDGNENMLLQLYGTTTIRTKDYLFVKDDSSDVVMIKKPSAKEIFYPTHVDYAKLLEVCSAIEELGDGKSNIKGYRLLFKGVKGEIDRLDMFFDKNTFMVTKVVLFYNTEQMEQGKEPDDKEYFKPRLEVTYSNIKTGAQSDKNIFSIAKYLKKDKKGWSLQSSYSAYQLIDQTQEKVN